MIFCLNEIEDQSDNESGQVLNLLPKENDVEVCCLLEQLKSAKEHIEITIDAEDYYRIKDSEN